MKDITLVELRSLEDEWLLPWLDLYETAFPPHEKVLVSDHLNILRQKNQGGAHNHHLLAAVGQGAFMGLVRCQFFPGVEVALLWYLAVEPRLRNAGLGAELYRQLLRYPALEPVKALMFEVEKPDQQPGEDERQLAARRIGFYQRQGALVLGGIDYLQVVGSHQPATPMHLMLHPLEPLAPDVAFNLAKAVFGEQLKQVGPLTLV